MWHSCDQFLKNKKKPNNNVAKIAKKTLHEIYIYISLLFCITLNCLINKKVTNNTIIKLLYKSYTKFKSY